MTEQRQIVEVWRRGGARVLITVVRVEGSSYRRPGARLLLSGEGLYAGTISGGCLEAEVVRRADWKVRDGAVVEQYSTMFEDAVDVPFGLGCGGVVDLLLEPVESPEGQALLAAIERSLAGEPSTVVTWLPGDGRSLRRVIVDASGRTIFASEGLAEKKLACAHELIPGEEYEGRFVERLMSPQRLLIFGAGDDAKPLVSLAAMMGWSVMIADGRFQLARAERFPGAYRVIVATGDAAADALNVQPSDAVVIMTHSYEQDRALLAAVLPRHPRYLGMLGARHRSSLLVSEAAQLTGCSLEECCDRVWAPVGLDLGGDGPEAIALAIMAEAHAVCAGKIVISRRLLPEDVVRHVREGGMSRYVEAQCALDTTE